MFALFILGVVAGGGSALAAVEFASSTGRKRPSAPSVILGRDLTTTNPGMVKKNNNLDGNVIAVGETHSAVAQGHAEEVVQRTVQHGLPSYDGESIRVAPGGAFVSSLNYERRIPRWVLEYLDPATVLAGSSSSSSSETKVDRKNSHFHSDLGVPSVFRATNADYLPTSSSGSSPSRGLSRGHLAPAQFHKGSQEEMNATFNLSTNIVPQDLTMNCVDWFRLESMTKKLLRDHFDRGLWVVSGPMFVPTIETSSSAGGSSLFGKRVVRYEVVGDHDVAVPTHLFKVILGERSDGSRGVAAFVMPNGPIVNEQPLTNFQVKPEYVERVTGLQFFRGGSPSAALTGIGSDNGSLSSSPLSGAYDICRRHKCEGRYGSFSNVHRRVAQLRASGSLSELQKTMESFSSVGAATTTTSSAKKSPQSPSATSGGGKLEKEVLEEFQQMGRVLAARDAAAQAEAQRVISLRQPQ